MKPDLIILKLGGSIITDKKSNKPIFKQSVVKRICKEIVFAKKKRDFKLIIVHGAGSFAHPLAKKYKLNEGYLGPESATGFSLTKEAMLKLSLLMLNELNSCKINTSIVDVSDITTTKSGKLIKFETKIIGDLLEKNISPMLFGNVVMDIDKGFSILSGDTTAGFLVRKFKAKKVIFASDVDGIFDKNPKIHKDAKQISKIDSKNVGTIIENMKTHNKNDVTGEMKGKILSIKEQMSGIEVFITNGLKENSIKNALLNGMDGTRILF